LDSKGRPMRFRTLPKRPNAMQVFEEGLGTTEEPTASNQWYKIEFVSSEDEGENNKKEGSFDSSFEEGSAHSELDPPSLSGETANGVDTKHTLPRKVLPELPSKVSPTDDDKTITMDQAHHTPKRVETSNPDDISYAQSETYIEEWDPAQDTIADSPTQSLYLSDEDRKKISPNKAANGLPDPRQAPVGGKPTDWWTVVAEEHEKEKLSTVEYETPKKESEDEENDKSGKVKKPKLFKKKKKKDEDETKKKRR